MRAGWKGIWRGWGMFELKSLSEISSRITDGSHFSPTPQSYGYPIANVKDMRDRHINIDSCTRIKEDDYRALIANGCTIKDGDVLLSKDGTVGKVIVYAQVAEIAALSSICIIKPNSTANPRYLGHVLRSSICARQYENFMSGSALRRLVLRDIKNVQIPLPENCEQQGIAAILDTLDDAIEKSETLIAKLKQVRAGMLHDLLTCGVDENGELRDPITNPEQFCDFEIGRFPRNWKVLSLESLLAPVPNSLRSGPFGSSLLKHELKDSGIPLLGIDNVYVERFVAEYTRFVGEEKFQELSRYVVRPRDVMITIMGTVGRCCVVPDSIGTMLSSKHVWTITFDNSRYSPDVACWQMNYAPWVLRQLKRDEQGGVMTAIRSETIRNLLLPVPEPHEMEVIQGTLDRSKSLIADEEAHLEKLQKLKAGLSADLLTGQVRIPPDLELP